MKSALITIHPGKARGIPVALRLLDALSAAGIQPYVDDALYSLAGEKYPKYGESGAVGAGVLIALGGDGTILRAMPSAMRLSLPLLGINTGRIGFLAESDETQLSEIAERLLTDNYAIDERMLLSVRVKDKEYLALNDAVLHRAASPHMIVLDAFVSNDLVGRYIADGMIISSPTGSTGYSLSAGGPIVSPDVRCLVLSPICPHTLQSRPVVVSDKEEITLRLSSDKIDGMTLSIDGQTAIEVSGGAEISVSASEQAAKFIRLGETHYFTLVREKLTEWSRS
jgi:NAD+ kinase